MQNYMEKFSLESKVIFVTGGCGLLGAEMCRALTCAGAKAIILDIDMKKGNDLEKEIINSGYDAVFEYFDVTDLEKMKNNIDELVSKYGSIDCWINSAYPRTNDWGASVREINLDSLRKNIDIHLNSYVWSSKIVGIIMKEMKIKGSIINLGSIYGVRGNDFSIYKDTNINAPMAYSVIKGGIVNLTRYLASYFGEFSIRVNNICPGGIFNNQDPKFVKNYENRVPMKRMGKPDDIASVIVFLASDAASYITGETIMVDGGWSAI